MAAMLLSHFLFALATLAAGQGLDVRSGTDCPSGSAIMAKLAPLLAGQAEDGDVAWIDVAAPEPNQPPALRMRLIRAETTVVADRRLPVQGSCDEMADTVATVLAAWETPPTPPPVLVADTAQPRVETTQPNDQIRMWLGASGGAGLIGGIAAVGNLELLLEHTASHLFGRAGMTAQTTRQVDLGGGYEDGGYATWRRTHGSLGLGWQTPRPQPGSYWQFSGDVDLLLGWLTATGHEYSQPTHKTVFEYGLGAGLRGQRNLDGWALWLEARANFWPTPERVVRTDANAKTQLLPKLDVLLSFGVSILALR
jgi:hypothetical protein